MRKFAFAAAAAAVLGLFAPCEAQGGPLRRLAQAIREAKAAKSDSCGGVSQAAAATHSTPTVVTNYAAPVVFHAVGTVSINNPPVWRPVVQASYQQPAAVPVQTPQVVYPVQLICNGPSCQAR